MGEVNFNVPSGDVNVGGDVVGRDKISVTFNFTLKEWDETPLRGHKLLQRNAAFVGRTATFNAIAEKLKEDNALVIVHGPGGMGKTQLALEFGHLLQKDFPGGVFYLRCAQPDLIAGEVAACGDEGRLNVPGWENLPQPEQVNRVQAAWLAKVPRLLIFDNCEDAAALNQWRPTTGGTRVLVTARKGDWPRTLTRHVLELLPLDRADSLQLLGHTDAAANQIAEALGDLPLALHLAGAYMAHYAQTPAQYLAELNAQALLSHESLNDWLKDELPTEHIASVRATFELSYQKLLAQAGATTETKVVAQKIPVPEKLLARCRALRQAATDAEQLLWKLLRNRQLNGTKFRRQHLVGKFILDFYCHETQLGIELDGGGHAERQQAKYDTERTQALEAAGIRIIRFWNNQVLQETEAVLQAIWAEVSSLTPNPSPGGRGEHTQATINSFPKRRERKITRATPLPMGEGLGVRELPLQVFHLLAYCAPAALLPRGVLLLALNQKNKDENRDKEGAEVTDKQLIDALHAVTAVGLTSLNAKKQPSQHRLLQAFAKEKVADSEQQMAGRIEAVLADITRKLNEAGLPALMRPLVPHLETVSANAKKNNSKQAGWLFNELGYHLKMAANYPAARAAFERALKIDEAHFGPDHPNDARDVNNLGMVYQDLGDLPAARAAYERALKIDELHFGPDHPNVAIRVNNLGEVFRQLGDLPAARASYERALKIMEQYAPNNPNTKLFRENLARVVKAMESKRSWWDRSFNR